MKLNRPHLKPLIYLLAVFAAVSCRDNTRDVPFPDDKTTFQQPVITPLKFSDPKKIIWTNGKAGKVTPLVKPFDLDKLPAKPYDTASFKPFKFPVKETKFDYNALPSKDFDISKLPSKSFKFTSALLSPPRFIKAGALHLKNKNNANLYELGEDQGLKGKAITSIFEDRDGLLWIATYKGVYRYDGVNLLLYLKYPGSPIFGMLQDQSGRIWLGLFGGGILVLDPKTGTLNTLSKKQGLINNYVTTMLTDNQQKIWVGCTGGINIIDPKNQTAKTLNKTAGLSGNDAFWLTSGPANSIWVSTFTGLNVIDLNANKIRYISKQQGLQNDSLYSIFNDIGGRIWVTYINGKAIDVVDPRKGVIRSIKEISRTLNPNFSQDKTGNIWVADYWGIKIIDFEKLKIKSLDISKGFQGDASGKAFDMEQQSDGQTWISTQDGLSLLKQNTVLAEHIGNDLVGSLVEDSQGLVWKADYTGNGIDILDRKTGIGRHLTAKQGLTNDNIGESTIIKGQIFTGSDDGVNIIDPVKKTITNITQKHGLNFKVVRQVSEDKSGNLWILGYGLDVYDPKTNTIRHPGAVGKTGNFYPSDIAFDAKKNIWIALDGDNGIGDMAMIDAKTETVTLLDIPALKSNGKVLLADKNGTIWVGSPNGICMINDKNKTVTSLTTQNGLIDDNVNSLLEYNNSIYAGTDKGITVLTPAASTTNLNETWKISSFGAEYGITKTTLGNIQSDMITKDGLYWWGDEGMTVLDLSKKMDNTLPRTFITGLNIAQKRLYFAQQVNNQIPSGKGYVLQNKVSGPYNMPLDLRLPHNQNNLQFRFASFSSTTQDSTWYKYILEGIDKKWSDKTVSTATGDYFNLSPGAYTFKVASKGANGLWGRPDEFTFTIVPPWWLTWWAYIFYVLVTAGLIAVIVYYRSRQLLRKNQLLEEKIEARTQELSEANGELKEQKEEILTQRDELSKTLADLKSTQNQLVQREKMASLGELTAGIAHEIQNPLNFVNNFSEVNEEMIGELKEELKSGNLEEALSIAGDIGENEKKIRHHGKRADSIIKGMLEHSRAGAGERTPTDINALADEYLRLSYHGLRAKDKNFNAELITHFDPDLPKANVVPQDISRVLLNLFNNAFYAVNEKKKTAGANYKPEVAVSTSTGKNNIVIKVKDNGNGIPDAIKEKIMQPFFTTKPTGEGTGLGLSLSYDIVVKGHGGSITVDTREGGFTEFTIILPVV